MSMKELAEHIIYMAHKNKKIYNKLTVTENTLFHIALLCS